MPVASRRLTGIAPTLPINQSNGGLSQTSLTIQFESSPTDQVSSTRRRPLATHQPEQRTRHARAKCLRVHRVAAHERTAPARRSQASAVSTMTGAWSLGCWPLRALRSTKVHSPSVDDRRRTHQQADMHPASLVEVSASVVPPRVHLVAVVESAEHVGQTPRFDLRQTVPLGLTAVRGTHQDFRVVDVAVVRVTVTGEVAHDVLEADLGENRHPVSLALAIVRARVAERFEGQRGAGVVFAVVQAVLDLTNADRTSRRAWWRFFVHGSGK
jgi:hypothetical protein